MSEESVDFDFVPRELSEVETIRHSTAHLLASAVAQLYPGTRFGFGPHVEHGFFYDMAIPTSVSVDDLPAIEEKMREIAKGNHKFVHSLVSKEEALAWAKAEDQPFKREAMHGIDAPMISFYRRRVLARRREAPDAAAGLRDRLLRPQGAQGVPAPARGGQGPRPPQARQGARPVPLRSDRPGSPFFTGRGATVYNLLQSYVRQLYRRTATRRSSPRRSSTWSCSDLRPLRALQGQHVRVHDRRAGVRREADELPGHTSCCSARPAGATASCRCASPTSGACTATSAPA
jgi:hypothetical protein